MTLVLAYCLRIPCLFYLKLTKSVVLSKRRILIWPASPKHGYTIQLSTIISLSLDIILPLKTVSPNHTGACACLYVRCTIPCKRLPELEEPGMEVLWSHIRPTRLPRAWYSLYYRGYHISPT